MASPAHATKDFCAVVLKSHDGFVALRARPTTHSVINVKLRRGDFLYADTLGDYQQHKRWTHITSVGHETAGKFRHGWISSRYVQSFVCPN